MKKILKYLSLGFILLFLFHFETLSVGPLKISHLWKGVLLFFIVLSLLHKKTKNMFIYKPLLLLSFMQLMNLELFNNPFNAVLLFTTNLLLPLLGVYVLNYSLIQLQYGLLFIASFFILAFIPYELGLLESYGREYDLYSYGVEQLGIVGPFQGPHAASTALAGAFLVILYFWFTKTFNRVYLSALLILCFYFLIFTYVRTGMLMVVVGVIPILIYFAKKEATTRIRLIFFGGVFSVLISGWVLSNQTVMDRITGKRKTKVETDSFEDLGSGRGKMYSYSVDIFLEANVLEQLVGMGQTEQKKRMASKLGAALVPHNGFLLLLLNNGVVGLFVFLIFILKLLKYVRRYNSADRMLLRALLFAYLVMTFFQNYSLLYMYFILILGLTYSIKIENKNILFYRINNMKNK